MHAGLSAEPVAKLKRVNGVPRVGVSGGKGVATGGFSADGKQD